LYHYSKSNKDYQSYLIYYLVKVVGAEISNEGFDEDEKEYAKTAKWTNIEELKKMRYASSISVADELLNKILKRNDRYSRKDGITRQLYVVSNISN